MVAKKNKKSKKSANPLLEQQQGYLQSLKDNDHDNFFSNTLLEPERRAEIWMAQADLGSDLVDQYSWATPDERALRILKKFSPVVEVGCGANAYWCRAMKAAGIDVLGYDIKPTEGGKIDNKNQQPHAFPVRAGGPEVLSKEHLKNRTLFLCYPDEETLQTEAEDEEEPDEDDEEEEEPEEPQSLGSACLEHFQGKYVVHVGELYGETLSMDQAPWGRSSGPEFQTRLASEYHCLLKAKLTNWLHVRDTISVWKRSETCAIVFDAEDEDDEEEEVEYRHVPKDERLPVDVAAPCLAHLLENSNGAKHAAPKKEEQLSTEALQLLKNADKELVQGEKPKDRTAEPSANNKKKKKKHPETPKSAPKEEEQLSQNADKKLVQDEKPKAQSASSKKKNKKKRQRSDSLVSEKSEASKAENTNCPW